MHRPCRRPRASIVKHMLKLIRETIRELLQEGAGDLTIQVGGFPITVELARTPEEQSAGLMHRRHLDGDAGMLFCYQHPQELSFWMRNTHIPLSIAFIDDEGRVTKIADMEPGNEESVSSDGPCRWALEANKGWFRDRNLRVGCRVSGLDV